TIDVIASGQLQPFLARDQIPDEDRRPTLIVGHRQQSILRTERQASTRLRLSRREHAARLPDGRVPENYGTVLSNGRQVVTVRAEAHLNNRLLRVGNEARELPAAACIPQGNNSRESDGDKELAVWTDRQAPHWPREVERAGTAIAQSLEIAP